ncbi:hypothetical protein FVR03_20950 [Pontibacter qinzhouensis]|uniref:Esterase-like activity of phytase family protein n=1 Tax=Pontibacter qinzhouensis TaxID=2603253 RepID=A0A5C8J2B2_9BACT|nr:hypothetical protein FVR03_20950 [Pontibacter qinzhouensis]
MIVKLFAIYVYLQSFFCGCLPDRASSDFVRLRKDFKVKVQRVGRLDSRISESSGFARASDSTFWTHSDAGGPNNLYLFNLQGELLQTLPLPVRNQDWEELAQDSLGNLYVGDFGNNTNSRRNLRIYKVQPNAELNVDTIRFRYADQQEFPPARKNRRFDMEAFFYHHDSLHLFSKSWPVSSGKTTTHYQLPAQKGDYVAQPQQQLRLQASITAADIAASKRHFALLGYGRLYLFRLPESKQIGFDNVRHCLPLGRTGQAEAILFLSDKQLLIGNEKGKLWLVTLEEK